MPAQIETFRVQQYMNNLQLLSQQMTSRFESAVSQGSYQGEKISPVNYLNPTSMDEQTSRAQDKNYHDTPTARRWILPSNMFYRAELIERQDQVESISALEGGYAQNFVAAAKRKIDEVIITAAFGTAYTGKDGVTATAFPAGQQIAVSVGASSATGLNYDKLVAVGELFATNDVDLDMNGPLYMAIGPKQNSNLLKQVEIMQNKYKVQANVVNGKVMEAFGFNFIHTNLLPKNGSAQRRCPVWVKSGLHLGTWSALRGEVMPNKTKVGHPTEIYADMVVGGARLDELKVAEVICSES